ncbi:complement C1q tumor necrosis factor-related protein 3-like [Mya arenaria]|uniref:complement C1q tumor necrosis factor-related protein 3-like n=1 Tax=Mya arenaria TaxID=6604 RepID=UPI0022E5B330|nr:complement C1q tumor necrosis factor-related protein 3-like [Mya arenaria]
MKHTMNISILLPLCFVFLAVNCVYGDEEKFVTRQEFDKTITTLLKRIDHQQTVINALGKKLEKQSDIGTKTKRHAQTPLIAFSATLQSHQEHLGIHQKVLFDTVITNEGNGYNPHYGAFVAPVSGTYVFSATLLSHAGVSGNFELMKNGTVVYRMYMGGHGGGDYDTAGGSIILKLSQRDDVAIQAMDSVSNGQSVHGDLHSIFSGFLLAEAGEELVVG